MSDLTPKEETMTEELAVVNNQIIVPGQTNMTISDRMAASGITGKDVATPRLQLMQPTSGAVGDDDAKVGDIINTSTNEVLGGVESPVEIVPMELYKTLLIEDASVKPPKFMRQEPATSANENLPWEDTENGKAIKRTLCFNFFCLLSKEVAEDDSMPIIVRFKSSSLAAGKQLATHLWKRAALNQEPYTQTMMLGSKKEKKDTNTYAVYTMSKGRKVTEKELETARLYFPSLKSLRAKVNEIIEGSETEVSSFTPTVIEGDVSDVQRF